MRKFSMLFSSAAIVAAFLYAILDSYLSRERPLADGDVYKVAAMRPPVEGGRWVIFAASDSGHEAFVECQWPLADGDEFTIVETIPRGNHFAYRAACKSKRLPD